MEQELGVADVVVASTGSPHFVVTRDMMKRVMKARRGRTMLLVDIAVPRNVDPEVHAIDNVFVFDIDDLEQQVALGLDARKGEAAHAEVIVEAELTELLKWAQALDVQPTVVALRAKTKGILVAELERSLQGRLKHLGETERAALLQMVESATNKLLHAPSTRLRTAASSENGGELVNAARTLFDLPEAKPDAEDDEAAADSASEAEHTVQ
jgi:glutamyl-tRNA reductase